MEKLIVLGTGHAVVKNIYNTCAAYKFEDEYFLVDGGGGSQILKQLDLANIPLNKIHHLFVTHEHTDHLLGVIWLIRMFGSALRKETLNIYAHQDLVSGIKTICQITLGEKICSAFGKNIIFHSLSDGEKKDILGHPFTFFDIQSTKAKQFGFTFINTNGDKIAFCGDEPYYESCFKYVKDCQWLMHEAFCLYSQKDIYKPYEKHHSTAKDAGELAQNLGAKHLVLWHSEEETQKNKKELYTNEAKQAFNGIIHVPYDLEVIDLL